MAQPLSRPDDLQALLGQPLYDVFTALCAAVEEKYDTDRIWYKGYNEWKHEYKYRRGGKTLCSFLFREDHLGFMVIFGKDERAKFETDRASYSEASLRFYDEATTFHDGKWVLFSPTDTTLFDDFLRMLAVKRRPNRK